MMPITGFRRRFSALRRATPFVVRHRQRVVVPAVEDGSLTLGGRDTAASSFRRHALYSQEERQC